MKNYTIILFFLVLASCSSIKNVYTTLDNKDFEYLIILSLQDSTFTARVPEIAESSLSSTAEYTSSGKYFLKKDTVFLVSAISRNDVNYKMENRPSPLGKLSDFMKESNNDSTIPEGYIKISIDIIDYYIIRSLADRISFFYTDKETLKRIELNRSDVLQQDFIADRKIKTDTIDLVLPRKAGNFFTMTIGSLKNDRFAAFTLDLDDFQTNSVLFKSDILMRRDYEGIFYDLTGDRYIIKNGILIPNPNNSLWHRKMINIQLNKTPPKRIPKSEYYLY